MEYNKMTLLSKTKKIPAGSRQKILNMILSAAFTARKKFQYKFISDLL